MRQRCHYPKHAHFADYGGRGITVCERWNDFTAFLADLGPKPTPKHSLDRIDVNGNYEPNNCRWATQTEQTRNARSNRLLTAFGETLPASVWAERNALDGGTVLNRINCGWPTELAVTKPSRIRARRAA